MRTCSMAGTQRGLFFVDKREKKVYNVVIKRKEVAFMKNSSKLTRITAFFMMLVMILSLALVSCKDNGDDDTTVPDGGDDTTVPDGGDDTTDPDPGDEKEYETITIAKALELCGGEGNITEERYYIRAKIKSVTNPQYGAMIIEDETGTIEVYGTYSSDGSIGYAEFEYKPVKGDDVLLHCILQNYKGTKEVQNARLIEYVNNQGKLDVSQYTSVSISEARAAEVGDALKVDGVVARITYANGMKPSGFILVDESSSIYVYDGDAAGRVQIGNKVEVAGKKDMWILEKEQESAKKFGYKGCNQLTDIILVSNDNKTDNAFDTSWIEDSTVKEILETPVTEDITTKIFKVNALVKKAPGNGFTNYYFYDLDGETGSYTYTQCNGSDFAWLDAFDGKICTVYLTALNAKSSSTGCLFRLLPVSVKDDNFSFNLDNTAEHIVKYYALDQFNKLYTGNPELELVTKVSSELLGFTDAEISYVSSNNAIVFFTEKDGKLIMECAGSGNVTVTITGSYNGKTYSEDVKITVADPENVDAENVKFAIDASINDEVTVVGIVGPSLVNRDGFYLIDETGIIAVVVNDLGVFSEIEIGNKVVITGKRDRFHNGEGNHAGQTCITNAVVDINFYGKHDYDTSNFVTDKNLSDFKNLNISDDYSTTVFVLKATVNLVETPYYTSISLKGEGVSVSLYCSSANQYGFLKQFAGQEITIEMAACNWNNKSYYTGCVLSVITEDGKILNTLNFDNN